MKNKCSLPSLLLVLCLSTLAGAQTGATLLVTTDMDCNWKLDGQPMDLLLAHDAKVVPVSLGEHLIEAVTTDGVSTIRTKVALEGGQNTVAIQLKSQHDPQSKIKLLETPTVPVCADSNQSPTWTDPATGLMWTRKDNGSDVNWNQAIAYCSKLQLAGYGGWRLPALEELQGIYDPSLSCRKLFDNTVTYKLHVKGNLNLSGWDWSSSLSDIPGRPWNVVLDRTKPGNAFTPRFGYSMRALCVRRSGE